MFRNFLYRMGVSLLCVGTWWGSQAVASNSHARGPQEGFCFDALEEGVVHGLQISVPEAYWDYASRFQMAYDTCIQHTIQQHTISSESPREIHPLAALRRYLDPAYWAREMLLRVVMEPNMTLEHLEVEFPIHGMLWEYMRMLGARVLKFTQYYSEQSDAGLDEVGGHVFGGVHVEDVVFSEFLYDWGFFTAEQHQQVVELCALESLIDRSVGLDVSEYEAYDSDEERVNASRLEGRLTVEEEAQLSAGLARYNMRNQFDAISFPTSPLYSIPESLHEMMRTLYSGLYVDDTFQDEFEDLAA